MKLGRILFGGVSLIFILVLAGVETVHIHFTQRNLQLQLEAHANETATAIALSLSALMQPEDTAMARTIINPVFDRGYFSSIRLTTMNGDMLVTRTMTPQRDDVPPWFRELFAVEAPVGQAMVSSGWRQMGRVLVEVHPEFAYRQLWETATGTLIWLCVLFAVALFATWRLLLGILQPLQAVESAALAISERKFPELKVIARARELANVVTAMNTLSRKLREAMALEEVRASRLMREAYEDLGSGTLNARGLRQRVLAQLDAEGAPTRGALLMLSITHLDELNRARQPMIEATERAMHGNYWWAQNLVYLVDRPWYEPQTLTFKATIESMTPADIQALAQKYLRLDHAWKAEVVPATTTGDSSAQTVLAGGGTK